jgi:hypothetical protein
MRPLLFTLLLVVLLLTLPVGQQRDVSAQANQASVATIDAYARGLDIYVKRNARAARYFADTSSYEQENAPERWREFKTKSLLDAAWKDGKTYKSADVWFNQSGELVVASFNFSSPSGDWAQYMMNYYRKDGTLAKTNAELRTFMGDVVRIHDRLYDENGKLIKEQTRFLDLQTRKPKRIKQDEFMDMEAPLYAKTSTLPFYSLLKKKN